jgi:hypothetical protein
MVIIQSKFIGDFVIGDNIVQNLKVLALLYEQFNNSNAMNRRLLCKPIIVSLGSIVEASLHDLHTRIASALSFCNLGSIPAMAISAKFKRKPAQINDTSARCGVCPSS